MSSSSDRQPFFVVLFFAARGRGAAVPRVRASRAHACDRAWQTGREGHNGVVFLSDVVRGAESRRVAAVVVGCVV